MTKLDLSQFRFTIIGHGCYKVRYETPHRGDYYQATINDMTLIDATKNAEQPTQKALKELRQKVKSIGSHYTKNGERID